MGIGAVGGFESACRDDELGSRGVVVMRGDEDVRGTTSVEMLELRRSEEGTEVFVVDVEVEPSMKGTI